jgi:hypothetical protein
MATAIGLPGGAGGAIGIGDIAGKRIDCAVSAELEMVNTSESDMMISP